MGRDGTVAIYLFIYYTVVTRLIQMLNFWEPGATISIFSATKRIKSNQNDQPSLGFT